MRRLFVPLIVIAICFLSSFNIYGQVDDVSEVTGLPIPIGAPVIYGQVLIRNFPRNERRPVIYVYLRNGGAQLDKFQATERGYYYFLKKPIDGHTITFEIDGSEVGMTIVTGGISNRFRQDVEFDWNALRGASKLNSGVVLARDRYDRGPDAEKAFEKAMAAVKGNKIAEAVQLFNEIAKKNNKDFVVWMMLGTIHFSEKHYDDARKAFQTALALKPDFVLALTNYGRMEIEQKNFDRAIELLAKAVETDPNSADANHFLGEAYLQSKKGSIAVRYLNKAIELAPIENAEIHLRLAALYDAAGYKDRAAAEYKAFLEKVKDHPDKKKFEKYIKENMPTKG